MTDRTELDGSDAIRDVCACAARRGASVTVLRDYLDGVRTGTASGRVPVAPEPSTVAGARIGLDASRERLAAADDELLARHEALVGVRRRIEGELDLYRSLFEKCPDGYVATDGRGVIRAANARAARLLNMSSPFLLGKPLINFVSRADCPSLREALSLLREPTLNQSLTLRLRPRRLGTPFVAQLSVRRARSLILWTMRSAEPHAARAPAGSATPLAAARMAELEEDNRRLSGAVRRQASLIEALGDALVQGAASRSVRANASLSGLRVLVVASDSAASDALLRLLVTNGADAASVATAAQARVLVDQWRPDLLVSDVGPVDPAAEALLRTVRELGVGAGGGVPAIAVTAGAAIDESARAVAVGFELHLGKPIEPLALTHAIATTVASVASVASRAGVDLAR